MPPVRNFPCSAPGGRWVAYQTESGRSEVVVQRFPEPSDRTRVSTEGGAQPQWSPDSRAIYYIALDGMLTGQPSKPPLKVRRASALPSRSS